MQSAVFAKKLGWIGFQVIAKFSADLGLSGNVFHGVGAAIEKTQVPAFVLTLGIHRDKTLG